MTGIDAALVATESTADFFGVLVAALGSVLAT
jgi:hypothetical protein